MTVKEKINNLLLRMTNDDFNFSNEDAFLVQSTKELQDLLLKKILEGPIKMTNLPFDYPLELLLYRECSHEDIQKLVYNVVYMYVVNNNGFDVDIVSSLDEYFSLDDQTVAKIRQITEDALANENFAPEYFFVNDESVQKCLNAKNYKLLSICKGAYGQEFSEDTINRMFNEFPFEEYGIPEFFLKYYYNNYSLEKTPLENLLKFWNDTHYYLNKEYPKSTIDKCTNAIIEKIKNSKDLSPLNNNDLLLEFIEHTDLETRELLRSAAYDRDYIPAYTVSYNSNKEFQDHIIELIKANKVLPENLFCDNIIDLTNPLIIEYAIKHGIIQQMIEYNKGEYLKPYEDAIVKEIQINPLYAKQFKKLTCEKLFEFPKIIQTLIDNKIIKEINLFELTPEIEEYVYKAVQTIPSLTVYELELYQIHKVDIICELIKNKNYKYIFSDKNLMESLTKKEFAQIITSLGVAFEDLYEAVEFTKTDSMKQLFIDHPEVFDLYLGKELLTEHILDYINHNEEFANVYNMDSYYKLKDYLVKKYNYNEKNFDLLVNKAGPNIIRYIENESIQKLLTISYEELEKVLNLFPDSTYTINDINASYDSLTQFMFGKENPEIVSIFPSFLHAIEDKDVRAIYHFKQILIANTKKETFLKIKEKYNLTSINDMNDLLNTISHSLKGPDRELYINILHNLTDEYILNERKNYRNNRYFHKLYPEYKDLFNNILYKIYQGEDISDFIKKITPYYKNIYNSVSNLLPETEELKDSNTLMQYVATKVKDSKTRTEYLPILKQIIDTYCDSKRADNSKKLSIPNELQIAYELDAKSTDTALINYMMCHINSFKVVKDSITYDLLDVIFMKMPDISQLTILDCFNYIGGIRNVLLTDETTIKQTIPKVIRALNDIRKEYNVNLKSTATFADYESLIKSLDSKYLIKRVYKNPPTNIDLSQILLNLDINIICNTILNDEELYNKLLDIMTKKKLHLLPDELKGLITSANISDDYNNVASFITFFKTILESERARLLANGKNPNEALTGLASILVNAEIYSSISSVYSQILGTEDAKLIKANPKPNDATRKTENNQRFKEAVELTKGLYTRRELTIPPFDKDFNLSNNKKINIIAGNFTAPCNLTHGERTGACMRIGGAGETLFDFCLKNPNGFHIRFEDPETHEYISRVSGFRNGNTVFLNELRYSCNPEKYTNEEVVEACRLASEELINLSKDSPCPIENVVISNQYSMESSKMEPINLEVDSIKKGLPKFYSDVDRKAIVLATTTPPFKQINFDKSRIPTYEPCRGKIIKTKDKKELSGMINRIIAIKQLLDGVPYEAVSRIEFPNGILYGVVSDDWYIYVDRNKNIKYDCLNVDPHAKEELSKYTIIVEELLQNNEITEENEYGL